MGAAGPSPRWARRHVKSDSSRGILRAGVGAMTDQPEANKRAVSEFYDLAFNQKQPEEAVRRYVGPYYRQHNPQAGDGPEPFIQFVRGFMQAFPDLKVEPKRQIAEGDLVVVHSHL